MDCDDWEVGTTPVHEPAAAPRETDLDDEEEDDAEDEKADVGGLKCNLAAKIAAGL